MPAKFFHNSTMSKMAIQTSSVEAHIDAPIKSQWRVAKYAPVKYDPNGHSETKILTQKRQQKHEEKIELQNKDSAELAAKANKRDAACTQMRAARAVKATEKKLNSEAARKHYHQRLQRRLDKTRLTNPILDVNLNRRVHMYAKYHKCPHGLANNRIQKDGDKYVINCDHDKCDKGISRAEKCNSCGVFMTTTYTNRECHCSFYSCTRCKRAQYIYEFSNMCYDKHNIERTQVRLTLGKTVVQPSFDSILTPLPTQEQKKLRERFLLSMSKPAATSFAESVKRLPALKPAIKPTSIPKPRPPKKSVLFSNVPEVENRFVPIKDLIETKQQGAALSNAAHPFVAAGRAIREKYTEMRDKALYKIAELEKRVYENIAQHALQTLLKQIFEAFRYLIGLAYDYCYVLNPIFLYRLWDSRHSPATFLLYVGEAIMHLKEYEHQNREHAIATLNAGRKEFEEVYREGGHGVLRTILKYKLKGLVNPSNQDLMRIIKNSGLTSAFKKTSEKDYSLDNVKLAYNKKKDTASISFTATTPENGTSQLLDAIGNILSVFPRSLGVGIRFLRLFFKENMPILMGIKALGDIHRLTTRMVESGLKIFYGECASHKEWLELQLCTDDNPIHALTATYMTYLGISSGYVKTADIHGEDMMTMRQRFYTELSAAEAYVKERKKLGIVWFQYKKSLTDSFNVPPPPVTRKYEPLCLVLSGGSGLGKSTLWKVLLSRELCPGETENVAQKMEDKTHTWNSAAEYQPGMADKEIIAFDDFMQNISEVNEALNVIALCTTAPYPVTVATITGPEIKGMFCEPKAVVICTNTTAERAGAGLADYKALQRRYDIDFEIKDRYDPEDPKRHIFEIKSCPTFNSLVGHTVDLETARNITSLLYKKKRDEFQKTAEMVEDLLTADMDNVFGLGREKMPTFREAWKRDEDFMAAFKKYVTDPSGKPLVFEPDLAKDTVHTKSQGLSTIPTEILASLYSSCLTGVFVGAPVAVAVSFSAFIRRLAADTYGMAGLVLRREGGYYHYLKDILSSFMKCAVVTMVSSMALFGAFKLVASINVPESGTTRTAKARGAQVRTYEESGISEGQQRMLVQATGSMLVTSSGKITNCVFVGGHYVLVPYHLFTDYRGNLIAEGEKIELSKVSWRDLMKSFLFDRKSITRLSGNIDEALARRCDVMPKDTYREDVCLYKLPASMFSAEKDISKHFWDGSYGTTNFPVRKIDYVPYNLDHSYNGQVIFNDGIVKKDSISTPRFEGEVQRYHVLAEASYAGRDASCGSLVVRSDVQETPILGIHTAANNRGSYFHYVTRQSLKNAMSKDTVRDVETKFTYCEPQAAVADLLPKQSILQIVGTIEKPLFQPTKTDLQPSLLYELMGPAKTAPAPLSHKDPRINEEYKTFSTFWQQMFKGYSRSFEPSFEPAELNSAYVSMLDDFKRIKSKSMVPTKKLDLMECLNGLPHIPQNTRMPMNTSCGYPYVQENLKKSDLFEEREGRLFPSARIITDYEHAVSQLEQGTVPFLPYVLSLKDERLKHEKITTPRTRIFTCGNVVGYLICRRYFYSALMQYYHAELEDSFCCPSLDRASFDWHYLSKYMLEVGDNGFDFDFKYYDRSLPHQLLYFGTKLLLAGQSLPPQEEAAVLEYVCSPYILWGSTAFRGEILPSGILITYLVNCAVNEMMHRMAWGNIMTREKPTLLPTRYYREYTRGNRGGDDTFSTVDGRVLPLYNGRTVAEYLRSRNMQVTAADKSQNIPESTNYFDLSFLKNGTRYERGAFLPVSEIESLYESTYWVRLTRENNDIVKATQDNATCSLRSLYFHGEEVFEDFRNKALDREPRLVLPTYEELSVIWNNFHCFPGSHTDFASREIQEDPFTLASTEKPRVPATERAKYNMSPIQIIETFNQSGLAMTALDKQNLGTSEIDTADVTEETGPVSDETIDNQTRGTPGKNMTDAVGASVQDAPSTKSKPVKTGNQLIQSRNIRSEVYMNDVNWDLKKLVQKFTYVKDFVWSTADPVGTIVLSLQAPKDFLVTPAQKEPFDVTRYWKGTLLVKIVIKSSPFYAGGLVIGFSPFNKPPTIPALVNMGALIHKLSQEEGLEFVIPFRYPTGFIDASLEILGTFAIIVNSALKTGPNNPGTISGAVYVSLMDSEFKLPEIVPSQSYRSYKFNSDVVNTTSQSGVSVKSVLCDINDIPSKMPVAVMCAGEGVIGTPPIPHFQDAPSDLMQLLKRWEMASRLRVGINEQAVSICKFSLQDIYTAAFRGFDRYFGLFRGSVNLRFSLEDADDSIYGKISFNPVAAHTNAQQPANCGLQTFDRQSIGMVTIPWTQPYFVMPTLYAAFPSSSQVSFSEIRDEVTIALYNFNNDKRTPVLNVDISVGDDFHMGVFLGTPGTTQFPTMYERVKLIPTVTQEAVENDATFFMTTAQSGMLQFVGRAIENTLPIVEQISELGLELDAHMITEQNHLVQQRRRPFCIASDLPVLTERFTTVNHNGMSLPDKECFGSDRPETSIYNLLQNTKSLVARFTWTAADEAGARLYDISNGPGIPNFVQPGVHTELCSMFNYWTGGKIVILDVHATQMHRGQLLISYSTGLEDITYADATQSYFTTLDLSEGRATVALHLPYLSPTPQRRVPGLGSVSDDGTAYVGVMRVYVQNPLRSTATVSPDVEVVVYEACASDFQVNVYGGTPYEEKTTAGPFKPSIDRLKSAAQYQRKPLIRSTLPKIIRPGHDNA